MASRRRVHRAYGEQGLDVDLPAEAVGFEPTPTPGLPDPEQAVTEAIETPLGAAPLHELGTVQLYVRPTVSSAKPSA